MPRKKDWTGRVSDWMRDRFAKDYETSVPEALTFPETSMFRPDLPPAVTDRFNRAKDFGPRFNEQVQAPTQTSLKGYGWLGPMRAADGSVMSEYSSADEKGSFPLVNPLLTSKEVDYLLSVPPTERPAIPTVARGLDDSIFNKAQKWADVRRIQNRDPFID